MTFQEKLDIAFMEIKLENLYGFLLTSTSGALFKHPKLVNYSLKKVN